ncbi:hypothetical protein JCM10212_005054, partial [Sporobolomyces blumeae]
MASTPHLSAQVAAASQSAFASPLASLSKLAQFDPLAIEWSSTTVATSILAVVITLLIAEQSLWRYRKASLPGHSWQI